MKKHKKFNFKGRPDRACSTDELRPAMNYIYIDDLCMIATNGHILVKIPLKISDLVGDITLLDKCYIHQKQFIELIRYDIIEIKERGQIIAKKRIDTDHFCTTYQLKTDNDFEKPFPNYKGVLDFQSESIEKIGISNRVMTQLMSCFEGTTDFGQFRMEFQKTNRSIHFHSQEHEGLSGILMPIMLNNYK